MLFLLEFMSPSPVGQYKMKAENRKRCLPNNNHSAEHLIPQSAVRSPEPTLPPRADPWDTTQSAIDHRVWTPGKSEQRFLVTWIHFLVSDNPAWDRSEKDRPLRLLAVCDDLETRRSHLDDVIVSCCVSIVNPRTCFLRSDMTHLLIKLDYRHMYVIHCWEKKKKEKPLIRSKARFAKLNIVLVLYGAKQPLFWGTNTS